MVSYTITRSAKCPRCHHKTLAKHVIQRFSRGYIIKTYIASCRNCSYHKKRSVRIT